MPTARKITAADALALSIQDRIRLVAAIWDSIAETPDAVPLTSEQRAELDRRLQANREDPEAGRSWTEVKQRIVGRK